MGGFIDFHVDLIKGGMETYGVTTNPVFMPGNVEPRYSEFLTFIGVSVDHDTDTNYYLDATLAYRRACLNAVEYLKKFGYTGEQAYLLLGSAPIEGRISGVVDIPNACCSLYLPTAIFDFDIRPTADGPMKADRGQCAVSTAPDRIAATAPQSVRAAGPCSRFAGRGDGPEGLRQVCDPAVSGDSYTDRDALRTGGAGAHARGEGAADGAAAGLTTTAFRCGRPLAPAGSRPAARRRPAGLGPVPAAALAGTAGRSGRRVRRVPGAVGDPAAESHGRGGALLRGGDRRCRRRRRGVAGGGPAAGARRGRLRRAPARPRALPRRLAARAGGRHVPGAAARPRSDRGARPRTAHRLAALPRGERAAGASDGVRHGVRAASAARHRAVRRPHTGR